MLSFLFMVAGCTPKTFLSPTYDFNQMNRIGILSFANTSELSGVENLFAKYLIAAGFKVVERSHLESVLHEQNISVTGYLSPETTRAIGKILGVDVLLIGEVSSYSPARTELKMTASRKTESHPVVEQDVMKLEDGTYVAYLRNVGTTYSSSYEEKPVEYTINAKVGMIAKLVDVETAEIIWIGSSNTSSSSALAAADSIARQLVKSFSKELAKQQGTK